MRRSASYLFKNFVRGKKRLLIWDFFCACVNSSVYSMWRMASSSLFFPGDMHSISSLFEILNFFLLLLSLKANKLPIHYYLSLTFSTIHLHLQREAKQWHIFVCIFICIDDESFGRFTDWLYNFFLFPSRTTMLSKVDWKKRLNKTMKIGSSTCSVCTQNKIKYSFHCFLHSFLLYFPVCTFWQHNCSLPSYNALYRNCSHFSN